MVLPSYEPQLMEDNTVTKESKPKNILNRFLHTLNSYFFPPEKIETQGLLKTMLSQLTRTPHDAENIVIIGIHGWFPTRLIQRVVGEPTGTSQRFTEKMSEAVQQFFKKKYDIELKVNQNITQIPLEGEGKVEERVDILYQQLINGPNHVNKKNKSFDGEKPHNDLKTMKGTNNETKAEMMAAENLAVEGNEWCFFKLILFFAAKSNAGNEGTINDACNDPSSYSWLQKLTQANIIFVAAHSQGTPVSVLLISKLLQEGLIDLTRTKVCLMAMAGVSHGPFPSLKSSVIVKYFEADAARELFSFNDGESRISRKYQVAMHHILEAGVKIVSIASWYDQVVPLYSAVMHGFTHPNIYRAVHIEGVDYAPDFMSHLVVFVLKLRNLGYDDHGLIVHLSDMIAGNVYGFGTQGHSTLYDEINTYTLAIAWTMGSQNWTKNDTTNLIKSNPHFSDSSKNTSESLLNYSWFGKQSVTSNDDFSDSHIRSNNATQEYESKMKDNFSEKNKKTLASSKDNINISSQQSKENLGTIDKKDYGMDILSSLSLTKPVQKLTSTNLLYQNWFTGSDSTRTTDQTSAKPSEDTPVDDTSVSSNKNTQKSTAGKNSEIEKLNSRKKLTLTERLNQESVDSSRTVEQSSDESATKTKETVLPPPPAKPTKPWNIMGTYIFSNPSLPSIISTKRQAETPKESVQIESRLEKMSKTFHAPLKVNPYWLPWIMSELFNDKRILSNSELREDLNELLTLFKTWDPKTKSVKDLKYILEPLKSRL
ncbi:hypothetical protein HK099_000572 [Clydaea vesicula]|uniref:YMC020W-like alpha/beta hydrolase domain-containing protein n=1 Tax=Clydaea vesicula TaxID=447962 RepID=A0AAD5XVF9_9FUNG|nr:hypothetical protein HK099_000572 [Clydaea vesicula]